MTDQGGPKGSSSGSAIPGTMPNNVAHWGHRKTVPLSPAAAGTAVTWVPHEGQATEAGGTRLTLSSDGSAMTPSEWRWELGWLFNRSCAIYSLVYDFGRGYGTGCLWS